MNGWIWIYREQGSLESTSGIMANIWDAVTRYLDVPKPHDPSAYLVHSSSPTALSLLENPCEGLRSSPHPLNFSDNPTLGNLDAIH
jgi:hypothetical protein